MHDLALPLLFALVALALMFDFLNGLHDAANSIATVVSTQLLSPVQAVLFAAAGNFLAYWIVGLHVAETVGKGIIDKDIVSPAVVFGALVGGGVAAWMWWTRQTNPQWLVEPAAATEMVSSSGGISAVDGTGPSMEPGLHAADTETERREEGA